jgi:hypothetical protein
MSIDILGSAYIVWEYHDPGSNPSTPLVLFKRNAISFDPSIQLNITGFNSGTPAVAASENNVYVVWAGLGTGGRSDIFYRRSTDGGASFGGIVNLSNTVGSSQFPAIAASGNNVYVVWGERIESTPDRYEIFYTRSTDDGASFGDIVNLSITIGLSTFPAIAASGNNVYVVWRDNSLGNPDIFYTRSTDGGASFGDIVNLSNTIGPSTFPAIAASRNNVYVVWEVGETPGGATDILYTRSTDDGASFGGIVNLSNTVGLPGAPAVAASENNVYVVWHVALGAGVADIFYTRSTDDGASFGDIVNLSNTARVSADPAVAASENNVYVVWSDSTPGAFPGALEIFYTRSTDGGASFGDIVNLSNSFKLSALPAVAASNNLT